MSRIGITIGDNIESCCLECIYNGANIVQIFTQNPTQFYKSIIQINYENIKHECEINNIKVVIHGTFVVNLCRTLKDKSQQNLIKLLIHDMYISSKLEAIGVVVHMGKNTKTMHITNEEAINNYVDNVNYILECTPNNSILILETGAGSGTEVCTEINELGKLRERIIQKDRVKFCIDTCHIFSSGYDLTNSEFIISLIDHIETCLKWDNVVLIHLNDSKTKLNSKIDRHADIGCGEITTNYLEDFMTFIKFINNKEIPMVLETPSDVIPYNEQLNLINIYLDFF